MVDEWVSVSYIRSVIGKTTYPVAQVDEPRLDQERKHALDLRAGITLGAKELSDIAAVQPSSTIEICYWHGRY